MTIGLYGPLEANRNELRRAVGQNLTSPPAGANVVGQIYFDSGLGRLQVCTVAGSPGTWTNAAPGGGDASTNTSTSVDSEVAVFSGTAGKTVKRATTTGLAKLTSGVLSAAVSATDYAPATTGTAILKASSGGFANAVAGTDYLTPTGSGAALTGITEGQVTSLTTDLAAKAPLASPALTGTPTAPTAGAGTNTTQVATTAYVTAAAAAILGANDAFILKGSIDCSANPNYPAADAGWVYKVSVAGKIGGASGSVVEAGDTLWCIVDSSAAGTQAAVGANWIITQTNIDVAAMAGAGLGNTGNVLAVNTGNGITIAADAVVIDTTVAQKATGTIGNAAASSFAVTSGLTTSALGAHIFQVWDTSTGELTFPTITATSTTVTTVDFATYVPTSGQFRWMQVV